jgi:hypothetical protein
MYIHVMEKDENGVIIVTEDCKEWFPPKNPSNNKWDWMDVILISFVIIFIIACIV